MYGRQRTELPKDKWIYFKEIVKMQKLPFCIYADFETLNSKVQSCEPNRGTEIKTVHEVSGFNYMVISPFYPTKRETYRGPNAGKIFLERILAEEKEILKLMDKANEPMEMTEDDNKKFNKSDTCYICNELFVEYKDG